MDRGGGDVLETEARGRHLEDQITALMNDMLWTDEERTGTLKAVGDADGNLPRLQAIMARASDELKRRLAQEKP